MNDDQKLGCALVVILALAAPFSVGGCYATSKITISEGYRDSTITKVSETGVIFKTTEVETLGQGLRMENGALTPQIFTYSIIDSKLAEELRKVPVNKVVRIHYEKRFSTWTPSGETPYFITSIEIIK